MDESLQLEVLDRLVQHCSPARRTGILRSVTSQLGENRSQVVLSVQTICVQVGNHLDERVELSSQSGAIVVQPGVRCQVRGLYRTEPMGQAVFTESVTTFRKTANV